MGVVQVKMQAGSGSEPVWEIAQLFPDRGEWQEADLLALDTNRLIELSDGSPEVLPMPGQRHQRIVARLFQLLAIYLHANPVGEVLMAPLPVRLWPGKLREPDLVFMLVQHRERQGEQFWEGADLVIEVVSPDDPGRDWVVKRAEYAQADIAEYWIVDPGPATITVLQLAGTRYAVHATAGAGGQVGSALLPGLAVDVAAVFAAAE